MGAGLIERAGPEPESRPPCYVHAALIQLFSEKGERGEKLVVVGEKKSAGRILLKEIP